MSEEQKPQKTPTPDERARTCRQQIQAALAQCQCALVATPSWKHRDDGTWSLVTQMVIQPLPGG